jgi:hypothetical protein
MLRKEILMAYVSNDGGEWGRGSETGNTKKGYLMDHVTFQKRICLMAYISISKMILEGFFPKRKFLFRKF